MTNCGALTSTSACIRSRANHPRSVDPGRPSMRGRVHTGCLAHWASLDGWGMRHGASHNLIYFTGKGTNRSMHLPAAGVTMTRVGDR
jgi:hypothetical protein